MWNVYSHMKDKCKKNMDNTIHLTYLMNILLSMFEYKNLPDTLPDWLIETIMISEGSCGVGMINGKLYTGTGSFCGEVRNFIPTEYQFTNIGIGTKRGVIGEDIAVGFNNSTVSPDWYVMQTANILTEIDVSERCNVQFARFLRIPKVGSNAEKKAVEDCVQAITDGKFTAMTSTNVLEKMIDGKEDDKFLDLTDVSEIDKLQYLNQYRDNIIKRFFTIYGQGMQTTAKLAQQTTEELHGTDTVAQINVQDRLKQRRRFVENINKLFGTDISVDFSECWKDSYQEMIDFNTDGTPENETEKEDVDNDKTENDTDN